MWNWIKSNLRNSISFQIQSQLLWFGPDCNFLLYIKQIERMELMNETTLLNLSWDLIMMMISVFLSSLAVGGNKFSQLSIWSLFSSIDHQSRWSLLKADSDSISFNCYLCRYLGSFLAWISFHIFFQLVAYIEFFQAELHSLLFVAKFIGCLHSSSPVWQEYASRRWTCGGLICVTWKVKKWLYPTLQYYVNRIYLEIYQNDHFIHELKLLFEFVDVKTYLQCHK